MHDDDMQEQSFQRYRCHMRTRSGMFVNADLNLTHFSLDRRSKSDPPGVLFVARFDCSGPGPRQPNRV
ncbi:hypothetical protein AB5N79_19225, partial [Xanthomonas citri pv. citri]